MKRRDFLVLTAGAVGLATAQRPVNVIEAVTAPATAPLRAAELVATGLRSHGRLRNVWLKVTLGWARHPSTAVNSNPTVVREVCERLFATGTERVTLVDRLYQPRRLVEAVSGFSALFSNDARVRIAVLPCFDQTEEDRAALQFEPDALISLEPAKHHVRVGLTGITRPSEALPDAIIRKRLGSLLDATRVLTQGGPEGGCSTDVKESGRIAWSTSGGALDSWAETVTGLWRRS